MNGPVEVAKVRQPSSRKVMHEHCGVLGPCTSKLREDQGPLLLLEVPNRAVGVPAEAALRRQLYASHEVDGGGTLKTKIHEQPVAWLAAEMCEGLFRRMRGVDGEAGKECPSELLVFRTVFDH